MHSANKRQIYAFIASGKQSNVSRHCTTKFVVFKLEQPDKEDDHKEQIMIFRVSNKHTQLKPACTIIQKTQMGLHVALS